MQFKQRGRRAVSYVELGLEGLEDEAALPGLVKVTEPWVLVTGDDILPLEHEEVLGTVLKASDGSVATVDGRRELFNEKRGTAYEPEPFKQETVQRWVHKIAEQERDAIRRYTPLNALKWYPTPAQKARLARKNSVAS